MRRVKIYSSEQEAREQADAISRAWGRDHGGVPLPRVENASVGARRVGRGPHGSWPRTERYAHVLTDGVQYAHPVDDYVEGLHGRKDAGVTIDVQGTVEVDPSEWTPDPAPDIAAHGRG